jgi:hypothetical protein
MRTLLFCLGFLAAVLPARAGNDLNMKAILIWGCDQEKPDAKNITAVSADMEKRLKGIFKWKHYFMITNMTAAIPEKAMHKFVLSDKCEVEVTNKSESKPENKSYEAKLYGEKKFLKGVNQPIKLGEEVVLAGDDKNATAWFVVLSPQPMPQK